MDEITRMKDQVREEIMREFLCGSGTNEFRDQLDIILDAAFTDLTGLLASKVGMTPDAFAR
jgi:hypothetical protein